LVKPRTEMGDKVYNLFSILGEKGNPGWKPKSDLNSRHGSKGANHWGRSGEFHLLSSMWRMSNRVFIKVDNGQNWMAEERLP